MATESPASPLCDALDNVLNRLSSVKKNGSGYKALCPAHHDTKPSLSIDEKDGKILVNCHAGCETSDILEAIGLNWKDLFTGKETQSIKEVGRTTWEITTPYSEDIFEHIRIDHSDGSKSFPWRRNGKNGLNGLQVADLPLYGLKWALNEPDDSDRDWIIVEGEKATDALHEKGYLALGTVTGASSCPSQDSLMPLLGRKGRIDLWPDNDEAGQKHMNMIAEQLSEMGIECYIITWPEAPEKGDAADFIESGGDVESLLQDKACISVYRSGQTSPEAKRDKIGTENGTTTMQNESLGLSRSHNSQLATIGTKSGHITGQADACHPKKEPEQLSQRIFAWIKDTSGWWETRELDPDLGIYSSKDKENRKKFLQRLRDQGIIEKHPQINKRYRYVNTQTVSLNFKTANDAGVLPLRWPLGIEKNVNIFPGSVIVVAGSPNSGKTTFELNFIYLNQETFPIYYFCSEMGAVELRDRLDKFPGIEINEWQFEAIERASDFEDVIRPDCVNVIDYLEMTTDLYHVNTHLTNIQHKIGSGIAVVAIQKKTGASFGRGQEFSLEKPKLYISMDRGKMQIIKAKSWARKNVDPNELQITFRIIDGCQFLATSEWDWPQK